MQKRLKPLFALAGMAFTGFSINAYAVDPPPPSADPGALQQQRMEEEIQRRLKERLERQPDASPLKMEEAKPSAKPGPDEGPRFLMKSVQFTPSEIFTAEELKAFAATLEGREVSFGEIQALVARINEAYKAKRIVTARAILEPQDVSDGILDIRLVEGHVGAINLKGNVSTDEAYITDRITLQPGQLVDLPSLENDLKRFNRTNDVQLGAELKAGSAFGTSDLFLSAQEPPKHDLRLLVDNNGSESTGQWRAGLTYTNRSLTGSRDDLSLTTIQAEGQESYSIGYGFPINKLGGRLWLGYFEDHTEVKNGPLSSLELTGESKSGMATLRQPINLSDTIQVDGLMTLKKRKSTNWSSGVFLQETESTDGSLGAEVWQADVRGFWLASYSYTVGETDSPSEENYQVGRGALRGSLRQDNGWTLAGNFNFQHTPEKQLIAGEQMLIGGEGSVRGYHVGTYAGEQGYALSLEAHHPLGTSQLGEKGIPVSATGFAFIDHARVKPYRPPASTLGDHEELTSAGVGINTAIGKNVTVKATLAYAINQTSDGQKGVHFGFQLIAGLF